MKFGDDEISDDMIAEVLDGKPLQMVICGACREHYRIDADRQQCPWCGNLPTELIPIDGVVNP